MPESNKGKSTKPTVLSLQKQLKELQARVNELEIKAGLAEKPRPKASINKPEKQISENDALPKEESKIKMSEKFKIQSMRNAIAILPPNLRDEHGRHTKENIGAICGFIVSDEMYEEAYEGIKV